MRKLEEVLSKYYALPVKEDSWHGPLGLLRAAMRKAKIANTENGRRQYLGEMLCIMTIEKELSWQILQDKNLLVAVSGPYVLALTRHQERGGRYSGSITSTFKLSILENGKEIAFETNTANSAEYDSSSRCQPMMDVYDTVVDGSPREVRPAHVCGSGGFGTDPGDTCEGCEYDRKKREQS